ncbi:caspase family protein [Streptomyces canus]|uniref:HD domain-containing protein n=1 Tax=Streptomyces canus TaxID=58343 RepID=UPI0030E37A3B
MPTYKALLIGASDYSDSPSFGDLPFVRDDLQRLREVLTGRGFQEPEILENRRGITPGTVRGAVDRFLGGARRGDTLLIVLSGHGLHIEGKDYLVPEDAPDTDSFAENCIEIGWHKQVGRSPAERVVFLLDTCREGLTPDTKSIPGMRRWKPPEILDTLRRKVAYVHACAAPQVARFVRETDMLRPGYDMGTQQGESFSIFSRAVADVITADPHTLRLREFAVQVQQRVDEYYRAYDKPNPPQQVKVTCETDADGGDFPLLPGAERWAGDHAWVRNVEKYPWHRTSENPARGTLKDVCRILAGRMAATYENAARALGDDPWHDTELTERAHKRLGFLVGRLDDGTLSPAEAALSFLAPLVAQTFWAQEAAQRVGVLTADAAAAGPDQARFHKFARSFPRLKRRLLALEGAGDSAESKDAARKATDRIHWWLFHRWLIQQPDLYTAERLKELLGDVTFGGEYPRWVADALSAERLMRLMKEHRTTPFTMRRTDADRAPYGSRPLHEDWEVIEASTEDEQPVRTILVAALVKAAQAMAVDPLDLPEIVVEHLGVHGSVDLEQLRTTVRDSDWRLSGLGRSLNAVCMHPAVQVALREHAARFDALLRDINRGDDQALAPLKGLPPYADGSRVSLHGNTPDQLSDGIRFQLAEDRVQELLMGEQLYGDSELAVRELYQNALDAARYRECRTEFLRRKGKSLQRYEGRIEFSQGVRPDGRPYLQCRDNGIGMGIKELSTVFSQGGARFVDLSEYIEEQAAWEELPGEKLRLYPNSRFGIGVLSYFMLADEIVVETCRMGREGQQGNRLRVTIAGPGNFFGVEDLGPGEDAGTTVQLLLSKGHRGVSCVEALEKVLWVAPYLTTVEHGTRTATWLPAELSEAALVAARGRSGRRERPIRVPSPDPDVWWIDGHGIILADGLYTETSRPLYGAVVNLHGESAPELTVDRKNIRSYNENDVRARMTAALSSLTDSGCGLPDANWLSDASGWSVPFGDHVTEQVRNAELPWQLGNLPPVPFSRIGFFPPDADLLALVTGDYGHTDHEQAGSFLANMPLPVLRWRLRTLYQAGFGDPVTLTATDGTDPLVARPSDLVLVCTDARFLRWDYRLDEWLKGPRTTGFLNPFAPSQALAETGWISTGNLYPWRDPDVTVAPADVFELSQAVERPPAEVAARLIDLGYEVEDLGGCAAADCSDLPLLHSLGDLSGWLSPGATLSAAQIGVSAAQADCTTERAGRRLGELGFIVPAHHPAREAWTEEDRNILTQLWAAYEDVPTPDAAMHVSAAQLTSVTHTTALPLNVVTDLLRELGFVLPREVSTLPELTDDDRVLIDTTQLRVDREVPLRYVAATARRLNHTARDLAVRLHELGYRVPRIPEDGQLPTPEEIDLLGTGTGLADTGRPVPLLEVARVAKRAESSLTEAADRLCSLGYSLGFDPGVLSRFRKQDVNVLLFDYEGGTRNPAVLSPVTPAALHAIEHHTGQEFGSTRIGDSLVAFGFDVVRPTAEWEAERHAEYVLYRWLIDPKREPPRRTWPPEPEKALSLRTLAVTAMRAGKSLREASLMATALNIRHEAETWFTPAPAEPPAPSAAAVPHP